MALESWEMIIFELAIGSLISGVLLFIFSIFTAGFRFGNAGLGGGHAGHLHIGHFHLAHFHVGHAHMGHVGHGGHIQGQQHGGLNQNPSTPILLVVSAFMLMFGAIGTLVYQSELFDPISRLILVIIIPLKLVKVITMLWNKMVENESGYEIPIVSVDNQVKTLTDVDEKGGLVLADTGNLSDPSTLHPEEKMKMPAKTLPGVSIERNQVAYVIDIDERNTLLIDLWPKQAKKENLFDNSNSN